MALGGKVKFNREHVLMRSALTEIKGGEPRVDVVWKLATEEDIDALTEESIQWHEGRRRFGKQLLREGSICVLGYVDGEPAHIGWSSTNRLYNPPFSLNLGRGWAYFHRTRTAPQFRGMGLQGAGIRKRIEVVREQGVVRIVNMVDVENVVSFNNYQKMGFQEIATVRGIELFGKKVWGRFPSALRAMLVNPASESSS